MTDKYKTVRTWDDGWRIDQLWFDSLGTWGHECRLHDPSGNKIATSYEPPVLHFKHWWWSGYRRRMAILFVVLSLANMAAPWWIDGWTQWLNVAAGFPCGFMAYSSVVGYLNERKRNGSNRRTEADHPDPQAQRTASFAFAGQGAGEDPGEDPGVTLDTVHEDIPILAHRVARIVHTGAGWAFGAMSDTFGTFGHDAEATCHAYHRQMMVWSYSMGGNRPMPHEAPHVDCQCGFYAVPADKLDHFGYQGARLQVELSGTIIEHQLGYRAEHQRVIAWTPPPCSGCGDAATRVWVDAANDKQPVWDCGQHEYPVNTDSAVLMIVSVGDVARSLGVPIN